MLPITHPEVFGIVEPEPATPQETLDAVLSTLRKWHFDEQHPYAIQWCALEPCHSLREYFTEWV